MKFILLPCYFTYYVITKTFRYLKWIFFLNLINLRIPPFYVPIPKKMFGDVIYPPLF